MNATTRTDLREKLERLVEKWRQDARMMFIHEQRAAREACATEVAAILAESEEPDIIWRRLLWLRHGHYALYGDDGEMQCSECHLDFKRDTPEDIEERWRSMGEKLLRGVEEPKPRPAEVKIARSDLARVFGHKCDMPTCPTCAAHVPKLEPGDEWDTPEGRTHYVGDDCEGGHADVGETRLCDLGDEAVMLPVSEIKAKAKLPLGHEFHQCPDCSEDPYSPRDECCCGQPRSAHEPQADLCPHGATANKCPVLNCANTLKMPWGDTCYKCGRPWVECQDRCRT